MLPYEHDNSVYFLDESIKNTDLLGEIWVRKCTEAFFFSFTYMHWNVYRDNMITGIDFRILWVVTWQVAGTDEISLAMN